MIVRDATNLDIPAIVELYNALIPTTTVAWTEALQSVEDREFGLRSRNPRDFPYWSLRTTVQLSDFAHTATFGGAGMWPGYSQTAEHTIHVGEAHWGSWVGRALLNELVIRAKSAGLHVLVGAIDSTNTGSIEFHSRVGFVEVARMPQVGHKFGRWLDLVLMQRILDGRSSP